MPPTAQSPIPIWLTRNSAAPIHDQLATQILLGILSKDLKPGQRLPSVRALARMLHVHPNTVSAVYQELVSRGWLESRRGSGVFVRAESVPRRSRIEQLLASLIDTARSEGWTDGMIRQALEVEFVRSEHKSLILFEPEPELREVLLHEIEEVTGWRPGIANGTPPPGALTIATPGRSQLLDQALPKGTPRLLLQVASIPAALLAHQRPSPTDLIAIATASREILNGAKTVLLAAGIEPRTLVECDTRQPNWKSRALACDMIISDVLAAGCISTHPRLHVFRVLSKAPLETLKQQLD